MHVVVLHPRRSTESQLLEHYMLKSAENRITSYQHNLLKEKLLNYSDIK